MPRLAHRYSVSVAGAEQSDPKDEGLGLYLHLPFCERVCPYCDFAVVAARPLAAARAAGYADTLLRELALRRSAFAGRPLQTVYFGGGTPSLFPPAEIERLLAAAGEAFPGRPEEITLEANPSQAEGARFRAFRAAGVTRLSLGVQSFSDATLKRLGRAQGARDVWAAIDAARDAGFAELSVDLIFGAPGQRLADLAADLDALETVAPTHVSLYELTIEPGTPFALAARREQLDRASEEEVADMYALVGERLETSGLARYEVSSYARPGSESRHNRRYWRRQPVLGLGVGAWSLDPPSDPAPYGRRPGNPRTLSGYETHVRALEAGKSATAEDGLAAAEARGEAVFLALRTREGLSAAAFEREFGAPPRGFFADAIEAFRQEGLVEEDLAGNLRMSERGMLLADSIAAAFV